MGGKRQILAKDLEWVEYPFLATLANANVTANAQYERTLMVRVAVS